jgi:DNA-binding response OmpR family regulator
MRIAILEDDPSQAELLSHWLKLGSHRPQHFDRGANLLEALEHETFDVLLLDWNVPDISGIDVLMRVRRHLQSTIPVLFITARSREEDVVRALREGADDYVTKPLRRLELLARLESLARRSQNVEPQADMLEVDVFRVDRQGRTIFRNDTPLQLSTKDLNCID